MKTRAVLFDLDGTLIVDVPADRAASSVVPLPGSRAAVSRLRSAGVRIGIVTNQPPRSHGESPRADLERRHARVDDLIGPFDGWFVCTHAPDARCACRKPQPGLVLEAARVFRVAPAECVVIGDIGSDVAAAQNAGARAVLVPTQATRSEEIATAPAVCRTLGEAVESVLP